MPGKNKGSSRNLRQKRGSNRNPKKFTEEDLNRELRRMGIPVVDVTEQWLREGKTAVIMTLPPQVLPKRRKKKT
jgi:hypothetical protein